MWRSGLQMATCLAVMLYSAFAAPARTAEPMSPSALPAGRDTDASSHSDGTCDPAWAENLFCHRGLSGSTVTALSWDDGSGEALYAGGNFDIAGCAAGVGNIARWDGQSWSPLEGSLGQGTNFRVDALAIFDDGLGPALYAAGGFNIAGNVLVNGIAKWDGSEWHPLTGGGGTGVLLVGSVAVSSLAVFDDGDGPALFVAGSFTVAGGVTVNRVAKWDGKDWSALSGPQGTGVSVGTVNAMTVFDDGAGPALYVGGSFTSAGGREALRIARWDGTEWTSVGHGFDSTVSSLAVFDDGDGPRLYASGSFLTAGAIPAAQIAKWDGQQWSAFNDDGSIIFEGCSGSCNPAPRMLTVLDDGRGPALYACGSFIRANGTTVNRIARWDGAEWTALAGPSGSGVGVGSISAIANFDNGDGPALYAVGSFQNLSSTGILAENIARWSAGDWSKLNNPCPSGMDGWVESFVASERVESPGLFVGGRFTTADGTAASRIARWDGSLWHSIEAGGVSGCTGPNCEASVRTMTFLDYGKGPSLFAGGNFRFAGSSFVNYIAEWDGDEWHSLAGGVNSVVNATAIFDDGNGPALFAGGSFTAAGATTVNRIAKWDGTQWLPLGGGLSGTVSSLAVFDDGSGPALYAGGGFAEADGVRVNGIAKWDGKRWLGLATPGGVGISSGGSVQDLVVFDDGQGPALYAAGGFSRAGGQVVNNIARWDGTEWTPLVGATGTGVWPASVRTLSVFDDGSGPALYVGGTFLWAGGIDANRIAKWDGSEWTALTFEDSVGVNNDVFASIAFDDGTGESLFVGGAFVAAGTTGTEFIAKLQGCSTGNVCAADFDGNGEINFFDIGIFISLYQATDAAADLNGDGLHNFFDVVVFLSDFAVGCTQ